MIPTQVSTRHAPMPAEDSRAPGTLMALEVRALRKVYRAGRRTPQRTALAGVDLAIPAGQWAAILGPNGSGKSTLVRILAAADAPDAGAVLVFGRSAAAGAGARDRRAAAARLGIVFQRPGLDRLLTVRENLAAQASLFGLRGGDRQQRITRLAQQFELTDRLEDPVSTLSGGFQRRVDLARALLHEPELLILDEATTGLDHQSRSAFLDLIAQLRAARPAERPLTVLMTTHLMDEAERAERVIMMADGAVVADGPPGELRDRCGGRILRVWPQPDLAHEDIARSLRPLGLAIARSGSGELVGRTDPGGGTPADLEQAVQLLVRLGVSFQVAPPDLGDAYLSLTGRSLSDAAPTEEGGR